MNRLETGDTVRSRSIARSRPQTSTSLAVAFVIAAACATVFAGRANAAPPVPFYTAHVTQIDKQSAGAVVITDEGFRQCGVRLVSQEPP